MLQVGQVISPARRFSLSAIQTPHIPMTEGSNVQGALSSTVSAGVMPKMSRTYRAGQKCTNSKRITKERTHSVATCAHTSKSLESGKVDQETQDNSSKANRRESRPHKVAAILGTKVQK